MKITNYHEDYGLGDEFRARVIEEAARTTVRKAASKFKVDTSTIYYWRKAAKRFAEQNNVVLSS